jgi:hypothetical protein
MHIDDLQFGELSTKAEETSKAPSKLIPLDVGDIDYASPPLNSSLEVRGELEYIAQVVDNAEFPESEREKLDKKFVKVILAYAEEHQLRYDKQRIKDLVNDSKALILRLKKAYNRPRPYQLADYHGVSLSYNKDVQSGLSGTAKTPSYPSGHATQAYLAAELLAQDNPDHREGLMEIAERVALARIKEGVHFPSDNEFAKALVRNYILPSLQKKVYFKTTPKSSSANMSSLPYKYTTRFQEQIIATSKIESGEWQLSEASLQQLRPLIPKDIDFEKNIDLLGVAFNAAVVNKFNRNDDGIDTPTALAIKDYFVNKPANIEHQKQKVVGHIVSSAFSRFGNNQILEDLAVKDLRSPFNIACAAVIYRTVHPGFADLLENNNGEFEKKISASWEIGFNKYHIALGSDNLDEADVVTDPAQVEELSTYLRANEGPGQMDDGTKVYRLVVGDIYPLGIGFTTNPAADVEGLITQRKGVEDVDTEISLAPEEDDEKVRTEVCLAPDSCATVITVKSSNFIKNLKTLENKISQVDEKNVNYNRTNYLTKAMENEILEKLERALKEHDFAKEFSKEAVASIGEVVEEAIRQRSDEYVAEKEKAANAEKDLEEAQDNFKKTVAEVEEKLTAAEEKITALVAENAERDAKEAFNARMGVVDEMYELEEADRELLASELGALDLSDESFAEYQEKVAVFWQHKDKDFIQAKKEEFDARIQAEVEKRVAQIGTASDKEVENSDATVETAMENMEEEKSALPNNSEASTEEEVTLADRFQKAFSKENLIIT